MVIALLPLAPAQAAEKGSVIRAGSLMAEPFIDAAKAGPLAANQPVTIVKGLGDEDIRNASVNYAELEQLGTLGVADAEARDNAQKSGLKENNVAYLKGRGK
jgi:hypothetical protein